MNVRTAIAIMLSLTALTTGACVARSTHNAAVADLEATKAELNSTKAQSEALTEQVSELRQQSLDIAKQLDGTTLAFKRARQQREADRVALQRLNRLSGMVSQLAAQQKSMKYALQRETKAQPRLRAIVEEYKSQLDEVGGSSAPVSHPLIDRTETAPPAQVVAQADPTPKPTVMTQVAPATPPAANPTPPLAKRPIPEPVEEDWLSWFRNWVMSFFESIIP
jgi:hypothetical protein